MSADGMRAVPYTKTENYRVTRDFLNRPEKMLGLLLDPPPPGSNKIEPS